MSKIEPLSPSFFDIPTPFGSLFIVGAHLPRLGRFFG